jgi:hypothetical protein
MTTSGLRFRFSCHQGMLPVAAVRKILPTRRCCNQIPQRTLHELEPLP